MNKTKQKKQITWDTLKWKDVVIENDGDERMVLAVRNNRFRKRIGHPKEENNTKSWI